MEVCVRIVDVKFSNTITPTNRATGESVANFVMLDPNGDPATCPYVIGKRTVVYQQMPEDVALDAANVAAVWAASFGLVITCYLIARAVGVCLELIRKG